MAEEIWQDVQNTGLTINNGGGWGICAFVHACVCLMRKREGNHLKNTYRGLPTTM